MIPSAIPAPGSPVIWWFEYRSAAASCFQNFVGAMTLIFNFGWPSFSLSNSWPFCAHEVRRPISHHVRVSFRTSQFIVAYRTIFIVVLFPAEAAGCVHQTEGNRCLLIKWHHQLFASRSYLVKSVNQSITAISTCSYRTCLIVCGHNPIALLVMALSKLGWWMWIWIHRARTDAAY